MDYPSTSGFNAVAGPSTPVYQLGSTGYPSGRPSGPSLAQPGVAGLAGSVGYPTAGKTDFTGPGAFQGSSVGGTGFRNVGTAPGFPGNNAGIPSIGFISEGQQRPSGGISPTQLGQTGPSADFASRGSSTNDDQYEDGSYSAIPGEPGVDYPIFSVIPETSFDCKQQLYPGYYADVEAQCQVFHICALNRTFNFLCPNGTIFSQEDFVCVWWNQFECASAPGLFEKNAMLYNNPQTGRPPSDGFSSIQTGATSGLGGPTGPTGPTAAGNTYTGRLQGGRLPGASVGPGFAGASVGQQGSSVGQPAGGGGSSYSTGLAGGYPGARPSVNFQQGGQIPSTVSTGYPAAGGPTGIGFPSGPSQQGYPGQGQSDEQLPLTPQTPTRDYLPPRQG